MTLDRNVVKIDRSDLTPVTPKPTLFGYLRELWERRHFIVADARGKSFRTTRDYALWRLWLILVPLFDISVYAFIFGLVLRLSRGVVDFIPYLVVGVIFFGFLNSLFMAGVGLIKVNKNLIDSFNFPRAAVVFSHVLRYFLDNLVPAFVAIVAATLLKQHVSISWTYLLVVPIYLLIHLFGLGIMLVVARLSAFRPETKVLVKLASQAWFYVSGVFFSIDRFVEHATLQSVMTANPGYVFLDALRDCIVYSEVPSMDAWLKMLIWSVVLFVVGLIFFWRAEERYAGIN